MRNFAHLAKPANSSSLPGFVSRMNWIKSNDFRVKVRSWYDQMARVQEDSLASPWRRLGQLFRVLVAAFLLGQKAWQPIGRASRKGKVVNVVPMRSIIQEK
jgi:hypothetical protein